MPTQEEIQHQVRSLVEELNAVLLVHYYQTNEVQEVADHLGDSLDLSLRAERSDADVIVFAGVDFMAETAKLVNPSSTVLHPEPRSRCPMAAMVDPTSLAKVRKRMPEVPVVAYVNTTADVKAEADICCTSANAVEVVASLGADRVIFVPDTNLALYVARKLPEVDVIPWPGYCHVHQDIKVSELLALQAQHPDAEVLVHPECTPLVTELADHVGSTSGISRRVEESDSRVFIIGTEEGLAHHLRRLRPDAQFHVVPPGICYNLKRITLANILEGLRKLVHPVELDPELASRARVPVERMLALSK